MDSSASGRSRRPIYLFAAAALVLISALVGILMQGDSRPTLDSATPGTKVLGHTNIRVTARVTPDVPKLSWARVDGANHYHAVILDANNTVLLQRAAQDRRETDWVLSASEFDVLQKHGAALALQVVAFDKGGREVARTDTAQPLALDAR